MEKIKSCPFCGSDGELFMETYGDWEEYWIECQNGNCSGKGEFDTEEEAVKGWNARKGEK